MTAQRLAHTLNAHGHEVRVVSTGNSGNGKYLVKEYFLPPIVHHIVTKQGMVFAKPDEEVLKEAIGWADLVHFLLPFWLGIRGLHIAQEMGVPPYRRIPCAAGEHYLYAASGPPEECECLAVPFFLG